MNNMKYSFEDFPERKNTDCVKWDTLESKFGRNDLIPLWVADMDFRSPQCIIDALIKAADAGVYGYYAPPESYKDAFIEWEQNEHHVNISPEWIRFSPGVMSGICWAIHALTSPSDSIMILAPCYYPFMDVINNSNRTLICSNLIKNGERYTINYEDVENKIKKNNVKMFLLCSPHNPLGHVWDKEELTRLLDIFKKYSVIVISDEIHQDIVFNGYHNYSLLKFEDDLCNSIILTSASKTFNLAALQNSFVIIPSAALREKFDLFVKSIRIKKGVSFGYVAAEAGFRHGKPWLKETLSYIYENYKYLCSTLSKNLPKINIAPLEGTYMVWVDLSAYLTHSELNNVIINKAKLAVDFGEWFWPKEFVPENDAHIRINIATTKNNIETACKQLISAIKEIP